MNKYLRTGVLSALLLSSHSSLANEYRIGQFSLNTINVAPYGLINGPLVSFNFSEINGLAAQQVQEIKDTIYDALSDTEVADLQSMMTQANGLPILMLLQSPRKTPSLIRLFLKIM